jgi:hypothetical protein
MGVGMTSVGNGGWAAPEERAKSDYAKQYDNFGDKAYMQKMFDHHDDHGHDDHGHDDHGKKVTAYVDH